MDRFIIVCVLYNEIVNNIKSLNAFKELKMSHSNVEIVIVDNSENDDIKALSKAECGDVIYIDNNGNKGLSAAYNRVISEYMGSPYWLMLADDDTVFSLNYLENVYSEAMKGTSRIISGIVRTEKGILSPITSNTLHVKAVKAIDCSGVYENIFCINSGLTIHSSIFEAVGKYDESLFLDMIDYWFMDNLIEHNLNQITIVDGEIFQTFSGNDRSDAAAMIRRFKIYKKDFTEYCKLTKKNAFYKWSILSKRRLSITAGGIANSLHDKRGDNKACEWEPMTLHDSQMAALTVLKKIDQICSELGLNYWIAYGTLLGAVRHGGFIPWDDDVDIWMHLDDYNMLADYFNTHADELYPYKLDSWKNNEKYPFYITRICNERYRIEFKDYAYESGSFVDVYVLYPMRDRETYEKWHKMGRVCGKLGKKAAMSAAKGFLYGNKRLNKLLNIPLCIHSKRKGNAYYFQQIENMIPECDLLEADCLCAPGVVSDWEAIEKKWLDGTVRMNFEDTYVNAPEHADEILKYYYGDYMQFPPEDQRKPYHGYTAYHLASESAEHEGSII